MFFEKKEGKIRGDFQSLKDGKYKTVKLSEWRSNLQNNLYWGWYIPHIQKSLEEKGYFVAENQIHSDLKEILLQDRKLNHLTGTYKKYIKSTAKLNKKEFVEYLKNVENYVFDRFEIVIPAHNFF